jgi:hypothetical protein
VAASEALGSAATRLIVAATTRIASVTVLRTAMAPASLNTKQEAEVHDEERVVLHPRDLPSIDPPVFSVLHRWKAAVHEGPTDIRVYSPVYRRHAAWRWVSGSRRLVEFGSSLINSLLERNECVAEIDRPRQPTRRSDAKR